MSNFVAKSVTAAELDDRLKQAVEDGLFAFWAAFAAAFPKATSGDFPPGAEFELTNKAEGAGRLWLYYNHPDVKDEEDG